MPIIGAVGSAAASGGRYVNPKPTITYNTTGVFNITNADSTANYSSVSSVTAGTLTFGSGNSSVSLSNADSIGTITNRSIKGVTSAPSTLVERKSYTFTYVVAPPPFQYGCSPYTGCAGTRHGGDCMGFFGSPYTFLNPAPGYTNGTSEWYKIT